jgi:hypothetical protein
MVKDRELLASRYKNKCSPMNRDRVEAEDSNTGIVEYLSNIAKNRLGLNQNLPIYKNYVKEISPG